VVVPDIAHDEMVGFYRLADVVVSIPVTDATPVSLLEAMAVGRPIVATDLPSVREWLGDLDPDGLVPVDDGAAIVRALKAALARSPEARQALAVATRARVEERADHGRNMRRMERLYQRAAGLHAGSRPDRPLTVEPAPSRRSRAVLLVAYFFPPVGGVGSVRLSAHARYLPASGWQPLVLGAAGSPYALSDPDALGRLPSDLVIRRARTVEPEHLRPAVTWARTLAGRLTRRRRPDASGNADVADAQLIGADIRADSAVHPAGLIARVRRLLAIPDDQAGWIPDALRVGHSLVRDGAPDAIFSSSSPISAHVVAGVLARTHHLPWIAEFRDPWLDNPIAGPIAAGTRRLQAAIERGIIRRADRVVFVTPSLLAAYAARYPGDADRFELVANGYERATDPPASAPSEPERDDASFRLVYAGSLYRPGELATFLTGVEQFLVRHPVERGRLRIEFVGFVSGQCRPVLDAATAADRLGPVVSATGYLPRQAALDHVRRADAALTLLGGGPGAGQFVGAKLYDYIGLDKQVFAMLPEGDARDVLRKLDWGVIVDPEPSSVADGLECLLDAPAPARRADPGGMYDRARLAGELGRILDEAVENGPRQTSGIERRRP
jgi:glycosyltransferase involved in cell wall biosynthesis